MFHVLGAIAQFERDLISERCKLAVLRRRALGLPVGRIEGSKDKRRRNPKSYIELWNKRKQALSKLYGDKINPKMLKELKERGIVI